MIGFGCDCQHLTYLAALGIVVHALMQIKEEHDWSAYAAEHGCHVIEERESSRWATVGITGHPRVGASEGTELWKCDDGTRHLRNRM